MSFFIRIRAVFLLCCLTAAVGVAGVPSRVGLDDLQVGQTGYGLTVFQGTEPDTFRVTILGIQHGARAGGDVILAELSGHGLETSAVAQGMSGSPVYLDDGRLVGAVAFGWPGALRPIAGLTPVADLDAALDRRDHPATTLGATVLPDRLALLSGAIPSWSLAAAVFPSGVRALPAEQMVSRWPSPERLARELMAWGEPPAGGPLTPLGLQLVAAPLGRATVASNKAVTAPARLGPGSACAVALVSGDAQLGAIGTVSLVEGERIVCMAHPFMQLGPVDLPLASAQVVTMFPSREMSFKIGAMGSIVGRVTHDVRAGVAGQLDRKAATTPVDVVVQFPDGARSYHFDVARHAELTPQLVFWCLYNALLAEGDDRSQQLVRYRMTLDLERRDGQPLAPVVLQGASGGPGGVAALAVDWQVPLQLLLQNRHQVLDVVGVDARLEVVRPLRTVTIKAIQASPTIIPGQPYHVDVVLEERHGRTIRESFELQVPPALPAGPLKLGVGSAREFFQLDAVRAEGLFADHSLASTVELLNRPRSRDELVVALVAAERGFTTGGHELTNLPGSVRQILGSGPGHATEPTLASYVARASRRLEAIVLGQAVVDIAVRRTPRPQAEGDRP